MSVYKKLMEARIKLQNTKLNKSGKNKFAGYDYFELSDFLPKVQEIFDSIGLCGIVSFDSELATLTIIDAESKEEIKITSPMGSANLKGCHEVQNIGAVETYQRRYLWVAAMEIVENDILDSQTGSDNKSTQKQNTKPAQKPFDIDLIDLQFGSHDKLEDLQKDYKAQYTAAQEDQKQEVVNIYNVHKERILGA